MLRRGAWMVVSAMVLTLIGLAPAHAAITGSTLLGTTATVTADGVGTFDQFDIGKSGGNLTLNGSDDWDSATGGIQTLADGATSTVIINAGAGIDIVGIGTPGSTFASSFEINGSLDADFLFVYPGDAGADSVTINGNGLTGPNLGHVSWDQELDQVNVRTGGSSDVINVTAAPSSPQVLVYGEAGDDTLKLANGTGLGTPGGTFRGGPGTDTVDYSAYTTAVSVDLGKTARFRAGLTGAGAVPPSANPATAVAIVDFSDLATSTFTYEVGVGGLTAAQITDAHLHLGAAGVNGAAVLPIGAGATWTDPDLPVGTNPATEVGPTTDPDITEPALRSGNTYVDVHSAAGDIRGQLTLDPDDGYGGTATGLPKVLTVENVVGGSGNDTFTGSVPANSFSCGPGQDSVTTGPGDTVTGCETVNGISTGNPTPLPPAGSVSKLKPKAKAKGAAITIDTGSTAVCPPGATGTCKVVASAKAKIGKKKTTLGKLKGNVAAGKTLRVKLKVSAKNAKAWRKAGKLKLSFTIQITVPGGTPATVTKTVKLKAPKAT